MRRVVFAVVFLLVCPIALGQMMHSHPMASPEASPCNKKLALAEFQKEFQKVEWPALMDRLAGSPALPYFKQGMTQYYGLNYEEAMSNFRKAKALDEKLAMASWGIALAAGPNINLGMTDPCHVVAQQEIRRAACLAGVKVDETIGDGCPADKTELGDDCPADRKEACQWVLDPENSTASLEKKLICALAARYAYPVGGSEAKSRCAAQQYSDDMAVVSTKFPDDRNVSTLYAESMMDLHAWDLYEKDGVPKKWTPKIVEVLQKAVSKTNATASQSAESIGANHFYIHAIERPRTENQKKAEALEKEARRIADVLRDQVPQSGHLVHMSSHVYLLLGEYKRSLDVNEKAADNDVSQYRTACAGPYTQYNANENCPQLYYGHYLSHNYFFGSVSATFLGRSKDAIALACDTQAHVQRFVAYEPGLQRYLAAPLMTLVVNRNWDAICLETQCRGEELPRPPFEECYHQDSFAASDCLILRSIWYWARGMARTAYGLDATVDATAMLNEMNRLLPCAEGLREINTYGNNCARDVLEVGRRILKARITWALVPQYGTEYFFRAVGTSGSSPVVAEDQLVYDEPPQWFTPAREAMGGAYLQAAMDPDNGPSIRADSRNKALRLFEEALSRHPKSGRALYGRMRALQEMGSADAGKAQQDFCNAWSEGPADYTMTDADLWPATRRDAPNDFFVTCPKVEKKEPSKCTCRPTEWTKGKGPSENAADVLAGDHALVTCPPATSAGGSS